MKKTMKAVHSTSSTVTLGDHPVPTPGDDEVLIENVYVASNPKDWKLHDPTFMRGRQVEMIDGNDVAGHVAAIGSSVTKFAVGDKVAGFSKMATDSKYGAYAEYTVVPERTTFHLAENVKLEEAATLPLAAMTAAIGLFSNLGLPTPEEPSDGKIAVLINGASSSVGSFATQLAKLAGLYVIGTAGASLSVAESAGADVVIDYRGKSDAELIAAIRDAAKGRSLEHAFDAISEHGSPVLCAEILGKGKLTLVLPQGPEKVENGVEVTQTSVGRAHGELAAFAEKYYGLMAKWLSEGKFKGNRVKLMPGGLAAVQEGLALLRANQVSGEKLVYRIEDTPGLSKEQ